MRLFSNTDSVRAGEPTALAILETLAAATLALVVARHYGATTHIVIAACVAPLLLLKNVETDTHTWNEWTEKYVDNGELYRRHVRDALRHEKAFDLNHGGVIGNSAILVLLTAIYLVQQASDIPTSFLARIQGVVYGFSRHPAETITNIPANWRRIVLAVDVFTSPDTVTVPREEECNPLARRARTSLYAKGRVQWMIRTAQTVKSRQHLVLYLPALIIVSLLTGIQVAVHWMLAISYRYSIKSTALVFYPVLWAFRVVEKSSKPLSSSLKYFLASDTTRVTLFLSCAVLVFAAFRITGLRLESGWLEAMWKILDKVEVLESTRPIVGSLIGGPITLWQLAVIVNAMIFLATWLYAREMKSRQEDGMGVDEVRVHRNLRGSLFVRRVLSAYVVLQLMYNMSQAEYSLRAGA